MGIKAYSENSNGNKGFYSEEGVCISSYASEVEAPQLIGHSTGEYGHCFFIVSLFTIYRAA
jgi:hypothetical protein